MGQGLASPDGWVKQRMVPFATLYTSAPLRWVLRRSTEVSNRVRNASRFAPYGGCPASRMQRRFQRRRAWGRHSTGVAAKVHICAAQPNSIRGES